MPGLIGARFSSGARDVSFIYGTDAIVMPGIILYYLQSIGWSKGFPDVCPGI